MKPAWDTRAAMPSDKNDGKYISLFLRDYERKPGTTMRKVNLILASVMSLGTQILKSPAIQEL